MRGSVNGVEFKQNAELEFPEREPGESGDRAHVGVAPDRWAAEGGRPHRLAPQSVTDEVVRLGEGYSIVTEYTSFLVLENDAEFKRWNIARKNALRNDRDRKAQELVRKNLDSIRNKAMADLGPQENNAAQAKPTISTPTPGNSAPIQTASRDSGRSRQNLDFGGGGGSGPVGPLFVGLLIWLRRLKAKTA